MNSVHFSELVSDVAEEMGWDPSVLSSDEWTSIRRALAAALKTFWPAYWWPETMATKVVHYAEAYDVLSAYEAGEVRFEPVSDAYYQTVRQTAAGRWPPDEPGYWARLEPPESVPAQYDPAKTYLVGEMVSFAGFRWYCHTDAPANQPPTKADYWGQLLPFQSVVPYVGLERPVIGRARRAFTKEGLSHDLEACAEGVLVVDGQINPSPWLEYQIRVPQIVAAHYEAGVAYRQETPERAIYGLPAAISPAPEKQTMYWGSSPKTTLEAADIQALPNSRVALSATGSYPFAAAQAGEGYFFLSWPAAWQDQPRADDGFRIEELPMVGDLAAVAEGYTSSDKGWPFLPVSLDGQDYRLYRTKYPQGLQATILINA